MEKKLLKIGLTVLLKPLDQAPDCVRTKGVIKEKIVKIGRKYFETENRRFEILTSIEVSGYNAKYKVFLSEKDLIESSQKKELLYKISKSFQGYYTKCHKDTSLDNLRIVAKLLKID